MAGYEVHVGYASGSYEYAIDVGSVTSIPLPALAAGRTHYLAVTAYTPGRIRSPYSNELVLTAETTDAMPLYASFDAYPVEGQAPLGVYFTPRASGALLWHRWDFGDGTSYTSEQPVPVSDRVHTYQSPGTYSVTFTVAGPAGVQSSQQTNLVSVAEAVQTDGPSYTFWGQAVPTVDDDGDPRPINVGMRFSPLQDGWITAIRFYKSPANVGLHVGDLWTAQGEHLGSVTFAGETAAGWQQARLPTPVAVSAGGEYVVSYHAPAGHSARDLGTFLKDVWRGILWAPASQAARPNGLHAYGGHSTFPDRPDKQANHWVDVVFVTAGR